LSISDQNLADLPAQENKPPIENVTGVDLAAQLSALSAERDQLVQEKAELQDMLLRRQAEFDNFRRRTERDRADLAQYAGMETVRDILPPLDDLERAMKVESTDKSYAHGIELIYQRMVDSLKKLGLEPIETEGKMFDPHLHQAVEKVPVDSATPNTPEDHQILGEFQRGYHYKGKLLRPSMVRVAVRS
jgi:molecular chaperone GrpE